MNIIDSVSHHATLFVDSDRKFFTEKVWKELTSNSIAHILHDCTVVDIDTARTLIRWANTPYEGKKTALVSFHTITIPAQNALLKIAEEPRFGVTFIFVTSNKNAIIPTLYSRLQEKSSRDGDIEKNNEAEIFLKTPHTQRMKLPYIVKLLTKVDEEGRKDRESVRAFILSLIDILTSSKEGKGYLSTTLETASYASDPSSSGKALLEYLSLLLPQTKD